MVVSVSGLARLTVKRCFLNPASTDLILCNGSMGKQATTQAIFHGVAAASAQCATSKICASHLGIHGTSACGSGDRGFGRGAHRIIEEKDRRMWQH